MVAVLDPPILIPFISDRNAIVGTAFSNSDLGWCIVSGWGYHNKIHPIFFYAPELSSDVKRDESHSSESEVLAWILTSPIRSPVDPSTPAVPLQRVRTFLSRRTLRKILVAKETLFKFGTFVPRNETEARQSPEAHRWMAGKDLEWLRMGQRGTFEKDWTWNRIQLEFPTYQKSDIGHLFYVFDFKYY